MTGDLEGELRPLRDATRSFLDRRASSEEIHRLASATATLDRAYWTEAAALGWTSLLVPEEAGGGTMTGRPFAELAVLASEVGRHVASGPLLPSNVVAWVLSRPGSGAHTAMVSSIIDGGTVAAWALAEDGGVWDPWSVKAHAVPTAEGYSITGVKRYVEAAADADVFLVTARLDGGIGEFLVPRDATGVVVTSQNSLDPTRGFGTVEFVGTTVPDANLVRSDGALSEQARLAAIAVQTAETAAIMRHVFDLTHEWVSQRVAFGRVIGSYQAIKHRMAEHLLEVETAAGVSVSLADALDQGSPEAAHLASAAKATVADAAVTLIQDAIQMHGGIGVTWEHDLHLYLRRASTNRVLYGSPADHRDRLCTLAGV